MADTAEMRRLMLHAADLLDAQDPGANAAMVADYSSLRGKVIEAAERATAQAVANGMASMVLRMVAAAVADEPEVREHLTPKGLDE